MFNVILVEEGSLSFIRSHFFYGGFQVSSITLGA